jgi:hypothetical protein
LYSLNKMKAVIYRKADFRAKAMLVLGSSFFMGQWCFIMGGTFVFYSWDVMEPISYIMMFANFTGGFFFYTSLKKEMELSTLREILANRFARRMYKRRGLDIAKVEQLTLEITELRAEMNKSVY